MVNIRVIGLLFLTFGLYLISGCNDSESDQNEKDSSTIEKDSSTTEKDSSSVAPADSDPVVYGEIWQGQYHLGPVDFAETAWHNACAPAGGYRSELQAMTGLGDEYLVGLSNQHKDGGAVCDACISIKAQNGNSIIARVVTYGVEKEPNDVDVSQSVFDALNKGEYPRTMNWHFTKCPDTGTLRYEFQTKANLWWTSLWVRNQRVPVVKVEVKSKNHADFFELKRGSDGTLTDGKGFGEGSFTLRITGMDGQTIIDTLPGFSAGELITSSKQFE
jgi:hypothetical protein